MTGLQIRVEFYGIVRQRAGIAACELPSSTTGLSLGRALQLLLERFPELGEECIDGPQGNCLARGVIANLNGDRFLTDPETIIPAGQTVLLMSADAGG